MRRPSACFFSLFLSLAVTAAGCRGVEEAPKVPPYALPRLQEEGKEYRTPRAGEGFRAEVLGTDVAVQPRDRRSVTAWDAGAAVVAPGVSETEVLPFASLFFWRHPDDMTFFRAVVAGVYNEVFFSKSARELRPLEGILTLNNFTVPVEEAPHVDGTRIDEEELFWGRVHPGIGLGYREPLDEPGANDSMLAVSLIAEPGFLYFDGGADAAADFIEPRDTFEGRGRLQARLDAMERNLLELPHRGVATGGDLVYGWRAKWEDWGRGAREGGAESRDYVTFTGYMVGAGGVPFVRSDRHRLLGSIHGGTGDALDRFSGLRLGGGPSGDEYESLARPILPGALIEEFITSHYAVAVGEYRWEPIFFAYLSLRTSLSYVERERLSSGEVKKRGDYLGSLGARITMGVPLDMRLQLDYNYSAGVIRDGRHGGHEVVVHLSRQF